MKKIYSMIIFIGVILAMVIAGCAKQTATPKEGVKPEAGIQPQQQRVSQQQTTVSEKGRVVFAITDAAAKMGSITSIKVTVDSVKVQSAAEGWVTVSSNPKTYDLLMLKAEGKQDLLADIQLKEGKYNQLRLDISKVIVTDSQGEHEAKLPSGDLKINGELVVKASSTSTATFDFIADESLHITGNGKYIMAPVLKLETKEDAQVDVKSDKKVEIKSGRLKTSIKVGMDADGNVGEGLKIPADVEISIDYGVVKIGQKSSGKVELGATAKGNAVFTITDAAPNMKSVTSVKITVDGIKAHSDKQGWMNVSNTAQTFDLLELSGKGIQTLMASVNLEPDLYEQLRLDISKALVTDDSGEHEAKLPSGELKIVGIFVVNANSTSTATFDFIANESLHVTGNGKYVMAPVIKLETKENADVKIKDDNTVDIKGGVVKSSMKVGMDADGNVGVGREISNDVDISIESGKVKIKSKIII